VAYRADIEIGVKGARSLEQLRSSINQTAQAVSSLNDVVSARGSLVQNIQNYVNNLNTAARSLQLVGAGTEAETKAVREYVRALGEANTARARQNSLVAQEIANQRRVTPGNAGVGQQGPALPPALIQAQKVRQKWNQFFIDAEGVVTDLQVSAKAKALNTRTKWTKFFDDASGVAQDLQAATQRQAQDTKASWAKFFMQAEDVANELAQQVQRVRTREGAASEAARQRLAEQAATRQRIRDAGFGVQGPALPPEPAAKKAASVIDANAAAQKRLNNLIASAQILEQKFLQQKVRGFDVSQQLAQVEKLITDAQQNKANITKNYLTALDGVLNSLRNELKLNKAIADTQRTRPQVQGPVPPPSTRQRDASVRSARTGASSRIGGAISGSIIGGAFPLLFGQGGGAAAGGAIGGLVGGLAGPGGSFAGSLLGTLLGDIASRGQAVKQLGEDLGFSAAQAKTLADAFKTANTDVEKFTAVIQNIRGVGLELEEQATAVQLVTALTEKYGGSFEKVGNAVTSALESGKVSQAVLNQLTSQGITVQDALAAKYDVSRDKILEMAKKGEISVQSLLDTLIELGNASTTAAEKTQTPFEKALATTGQLFQGFWKEVQTIFAGISSNGADAATGLINLFNTLLKEVLFPLGRLLARIAALFIDVVATGARAATDLITGFRGVASAIGDAIMNIVNMIPGLRTIVGLARQLLKGVTGRKSSDWNDMPWPEGVPKPGSAGMIGSITAPSQAAPTGSAGRGAKPPEDRTAQLLDDLDAMRLISTTQDGIRDALFEGNMELAARLEYDQKIADITRDTSKALRNANYESEKAAILAQQAVRVKDAELQLEDKQREIVTQRFQDELRAQEAVRNAVKPFKDLVQQQELQAQYSKTYLRLVTEGMLPAEAERIANFEQLVIQQTTAVEEQLKITEAAILEAKARGASTVELEKQLNTLKQQQTAIQGAAAAGPGQGMTDEQRAANAIAQIRGEINSLADPINAAVTGANAIGSAFQQAFQGLVTGSMTAQEALSSFFKSIGEAFVSMAAEIIAKQLVMITLQTILKALGFAGGGSPRWRRWDTYGPEWNSDVQRARFSDARRYGICRRRLCHRTDQCTDRRRWRERVCHPREQDAWSDVALCRRRTR
jgi:hypothetical protein